MATDERGVLYIGSTRDSENGLHRRIKSLWNSLLMARGHIKRKRWPHTFGISLLYTGLIQHVKNEDIWVWFKDFDDPEEARDQKMLALLLYSRRYGEPPPLNLQVSRQYLVAVNHAETGRYRVARELNFEIEKLLHLLTFPASLNEHPRDK